MYFIGVALEILIDIFQFPRGSLGEMQIMDCIARLGRIWRLTNRLLQQNINNVY